MYICISIDIGIDIDMCICVYLEIEKDFKELVCVIVAWQVQNLQGGPAS